MKLVTGTLSTLARGPRAAAGLLAGAITHGAWYVAYQLDGTTHEREPGAPAPARTRGRKRG